MNIKPCDWLNHMVSLCLHDKYYHFWSIFTRCGWIMWLWNLPLLSLPCWLTLNQILVVLSILKIWQYVCALRASLINNNPHLCKKPIPVLLGIEETECLHSLSCHVDEGMHLNKISWFDRTGLLNYFKYNHIIFAFTMFSDTWLDYFCQQWMHLSSPCVPFYQHG